LKKKDPGGGGRRASGWGTLETSEQPIVNRVEKAVGKGSKVRKSGGKIRRGEQQQKRGRV